MAKTDLSAALTLVKQRPDVKYSNIGNIVRELTQMGFDPKTAKMAVMMVFQDGSEVSYLKSSGVNALQAAKVMFSANIDLGQILDALLEMGYTREDASNAIDMLNTDEGSQSITQHTDIPEGDDDAFADYADPGYKYDDVPPQALQELVDHAESDRDQIDSSFIRTMLEKYNVSPQSIQQLINELFGSKTSALRRVVIEDDFYDKPKKNKENSKAEKVLEEPETIPETGEKVKDFEDELNKTWFNPDTEWQEYGGREGVYKEHIVLPFHSPANAFARNLPPNFAPVRATANALGLGDIKRAIDEFQYVRNMHNPAWQDWLEELKEKIRDRLIETLGEERGEQEYDRLYEYALGKKKRKLTVAPIYKNHPAYRKDRKPYLWDNPDFSLVPKQFALTSSIEKNSVELSWRELGLTLQDKGISQDQIIKELKRAGASDEEAHAASLPREQGAPDQGEEGYPAADLSGVGPESDAPEDLDMGPSGDFPYSAGMGDEEGPGGINDSLEGAPGPNDFDATGGGFIGGPDDTEDGQYFTEGQDSGQAPEMGSDQDVGYWGSRGQDFVSNDPQMTKTDLVQILQNEGASEEEANQVAENLELEDDPAISPGTIVRASGNTGEVTGIWDTLYGKMASVQLENGGEYEFPIEDLEKVQQDKLASTRDELLDKIAAHLSGDWYDALDALPEDYRNTYSERIKAATQLQREVHNRISTTKDVGEMGLLGEAKVALANEITFCQTRLASADFVGEDEYVNSLPKYEFGKEAAGGYDFGPGGGESIFLIAAEMEEELEATNWNEFARIASVEFVSEVSPNLIGDAQEVARLATTYISPKVSMLSSEKALEVANDFLANVEKVRRSFVAQMRTSVYENLPDWPGLGGLSLEERVDADNYLNQLIQQGLEAVKNNEDLYGTKLNNYSEIDIKNQIEHDFWEYVLDNLNINSRFNTHGDTTDILDYASSTIEESPLGQQLQMNQGAGRVGDMLGESLLQGLRGLRGSNASNKKSFTEDMWEDKWRTAKTKEDNSDEGWLL